MRNEAFLPSRHGFPCVLPTPEGEDFGLGMSALGSFGLSAGTVWVALDRYFAGRPLPEVESAGESQDALLQTLVRRQRDALAHAGWHQLRDWQALPARGVPSRKGLAERSRAEFRRLRQSLDDGMPVMLYLVLAQGRHADPSQNVAVLAYDYEFDRRARRASVRVYDPSRPGNDNVRLVFHAGADRGLDARLAVQTAVRGFFCVPYDRPEPASITVQGAGNENERISKLLAVHGSATDNTFEAIGLHRDGRLIHVRRRRSGEYATEHVDVDVLDGCDIEQAALVGSGRSVLWTSKGELIDCRRRPGLGWRARRITDTRTHGRFDGTASGVARERGRVSLFACGTGRLMHFHRGRLPAWEAEHVDAGLLARAACVGTPAGVRLGNAMHVVARTRSGELVHARWRARGGWTAENITARASDRERFLVADDPILLADKRGRAVAAVGRSKNGSMLLFRWTERSGWRTCDLSSAAGHEKRSSLRSVSAITAAIEPDGTVHVTGRSAEGGLLHAWYTRDGTAGVHDLSKSRPRLGNSARIDSAPLVIAGPSDGLHVLARRDSELLLFRWAHNADWNIESLTHEREHAHGTQAALVSADDGVAHAALLDADGRVQHAMFTPRRMAGRRMRVPTWLVDVLMLPLTLTGILADGVSALIGLARGSTASRAVPSPAAISDGVVARPRHVPASALEQLPEAEAATPLPLLPEAAAEQPASASPPAVVNAPAVDDEPAEQQVTGHSDAWSSDTTTDATDGVLRGPLDHLLSFFDKTRTTEPEAASQDSPVAEADVSADAVAASELPAADVVEESSTRVDEPPSDIEPEPVAEADPEPEPVAEADPEPEPVVVADPEPDPVAVTDPEPEAVADADDALDPIHDAAADEPAADVVVEPAALSAVTPTAPRKAPPAEVEADPIVVVPTHEPDGKASAGTPASEDAGKPAPVTAEATRAKPHADATADATARDKDLIVVYPEPEKRTGKGARNKGAATPSANGKAVPAKAATDKRPTKPVAGDKPEQDDRKTSGRDNSKRADDRVKQASSQRADDKPGRPDAQRETGKPVRAEAPRAEDKRERTESQRADDKPMGAQPTDDAPPENADPLPLLHDGKPSESEPVVASAEPAEPWALPNFEVTSPGDDWNAPDDEPWSATPLEGLEPATHAPDTDDWSLPPVEGLEASVADAAPDTDDWSLPPVEGLQDTATEATPAAEPPAVEPFVPLIETTAAETRKPSISDTDDDWNLPDDAPVVVPQPIEVASGTASASDSGLTVVDGVTDDVVSTADETQVAESAVSSDSARATDTASREEPAEAEVPRRRKWQNPALEGLPLLDDTDDAAPAAKKPVAEPVSPPARQPAANARKKPKKASASEMERIIALAEASQPELLPPD